MKETMKAPEGYEFEIIDKDTVKLVKKEDKKLKITDVQNMLNGKHMVHINGKCTYNYYDEEQQGIGFKGQEVSGHKAMLFLFTCTGTWYDQQGNEIEGYLYFKPNGE